jgi:hypothetical protein
MKKLAILAGFKEEAATIRSQPNLTILYGDARDDLDSHIPVDVFGAIAWGSCGALRPGIAVGAACVTAKLITEHDGMLHGEMSDTGWDFRVRSILFRSGMFNVRPVINYSDKAEHGATIAEKLALYKRTQADTCEEVAYAVQAWADRHGKPWLNVNSPSDAFNQAVWMGPGVIDVHGNVNVEQAIAQILRLSPDDRSIVLQEAWTFETARHTLTNAAYYLAAAGWGIPGGF